MATHHYSAQRSIGPAKVTQGDYASPELTGLVVVSERNEHDATPASVKRVR